MTFVSSAATRRAKALPMLPRPTMPTVSPWIAPVCGCRAPSRPQPAVHLPVRDDDPAVPGQEQRQRVIRDLADPEVGDVDDDHAQLGRGRYVDDVVADARAHDDLEAFERAHHRA